MKLGRALSLLLVLAAAGCTHSSATTPTPTACAYSLAANTQAAPGGGGAFAVTVTKTSGSCTWTAASDATWITFSGSATGSDTGTLTYTAAPNPGTASRTGTVTVSWTGGSAQVVVTEAGLPALPPAGCPFVVAPTTQAVPVGGGSFAVTVTPTGTGCAWTASADASWIAITSGASGTGTGTVLYTATANPDSTVRAGTITVQWATGTATVTVTQAPVTTCVYTLSPTKQDVSAAGGSGLTFTATLSTGSGCSWTATTATPWITLTGATAGASPGLITYSVAANADTAARTGVIRIGWSGGSADFMVNQAGASTPVFNVSFSLFDPGRMTTPTTECQIKSATSVPTTCTLVATASLPTAIVTYDWLVQYPYGFQRILPQAGSSATFSFQESCGQFTASDGGTTEALSVQLTVTDAVGNTATVRSNAGSQPPLTIRFFTCGL